MKIVFIPIIVVLLDQISKISVKNYWINNNLFYSKLNVIGDYLRIVFIENPGIAFGIDTSSYHFFITVLTIFAVCFLVAYLYYLILQKSYERYYCN